MGKTQRKKKSRYGNCEEDAADECIAKMTVKQRVVVEELFSKCLKMDIVHKPINASRDELQQSNFDSGVCDIIVEQSRLSIEARRKGLDPRSTPQVSKTMAETKKLLPAMGIWTQDIVDANVTWHCECMDNTLRYMCAIYVFVLLRE
jgi:hypothetical protein